MIAVDVARAPLADALAFGPVSWDALCERSACHSPFLSWGWHRAWADTAPPLEQDASEVLMLHGTSGSLEAMLPIRRCRLRFRRRWVQALTWAIGDVGCPDELDVPMQPDADVDALADALEALPWNVMLLPNLMEGAPNAERLSAALVARGHAARYQPLWGCPRLVLPASWDDYLATLSANRRQIVRRKERSLRRAHEVTIVDYDAAALDDGWAHLLALHDRRWNGEGAFQDPRTAALQRQFAGEMARQGRLWLSTLDIDGRPAAAWYGFTAGDTVYFYQGGRDPRWQRESVGLVLMGAMIRRAIERGYRTFDFLRGDDEYKYAWAPVRRTTEELVVFRAGWNGRWLRLLDAVASLRGNVAGGAA
ncbi:MAG TPA: GNAT family N-acetyltransferase [Gemmatimonadales bacterium]|nr:GNAT family N-acetyltransferase [Gemmatimonadales bacterium]